MSDKKKKDLGPNDLIEMFNHFDNLLMSKENLFVPVVLAIIPATLLSWKDLNQLTVLIVGIASNLLYFYHLLVTFRFKEIQFNINEKMKAFNADFSEIVEPENKYLNIRALRIYLQIFLIILWAALYWIKISEISNCN